MIGGTASLAETSHDHHFDAPYQCDRSRESTSSSTGLKTIRLSRSVYFPATSWRINLSNVSSETVLAGGLGTANLFAPGFRYDGYYREDDQGIISVTMGTAWPQDESKTGLTARLKADDDIDKCVLLDADEIAIYTFDGLDDLEVMGE